MIVLYWTALDSEVFLILCPLHVWKWEEQKMTFQYNVVQCNSIFNYDLCNKHIIEITHATMLNIMGFVKIVAMTGLLHWTALDFTSVPNKRANK